MGAAIPLGSVRHRKGTVLLKPERAAVKIEAKGHNLCQNCDLGGRKRGDKYINRNHSLHLPSPLLLLPPTDQNQWESKAQESTSNGVLEVSLLEHREEQRIDLEEGSIT